MPARHCRHPDPLLGDPAFSWSSVVWWRSGWDLAFIGSCWCPADSGVGVSDRLWVLPAGLCTVSTAVGAVVSAKMNIPGEPWNMQVPGSVRVHLAAGLGSGLSAPWAMPVATLVAASGRSGARWPAWTCVGVGSALLVGTLVEPVTWGRRARSPVVAASVLLNLVSAAALVAAGWRSLVAGSGARARGWLLAYLAVASFCSRGLRTLTRPRWHHRPFASVRRPGQRRPCSRDSPTQCPMALGTSRLPSR